MNNAINVILKVLIHYKSIMKLHWVVMINMYLSSYLQVRNYPFDVQVCNLTFGSWIYNSQSLHLIWDDRYSFNRPLHTAESGKSTQ